MRLKIIIGTIIVLILAIAYWVSGVSFIDVTIVNAPGSSQLTYQMHTQGSDKTVQENVSTNSFRIRVGRGNHEVYVKQGDKGYFGVVKTGGFFSSNALNGTLKPEKARSFAGDYPDACLAYAGRNLISYKCNDRLSTAGIHIPASKSQPTYVDRTVTQGYNGGIIEGFVRLSSGDYMLLKWPEEGETEPGHYLYKVGNNLSMSQERILKDMNAGGAYNIKPYKTGFIVYDNSLGDVLYYATPSSSPTRLDGFRSSNGSYNPVALDSHDSSLAALFTGSIEQDKSGSEIKVRDSGGNLSFTTSANYSRIALCGNKKVCLLSDDTLDVYSYGFGAASKLFSLDNVRDFTVVGSQLLVANQTGILNVDVNNQNGYFDYSFGGYSFNKIFPQPNGYLLSLSDDKGKSIALFVEDKSTANDNIDKKVLDLRSLPEIKNISANGKFIYITPNLGEPTFNNSLGIFTYDSATKRTVNNTINQKIANQNIDTKVYTIINTSP